MMGSVQKTLFGLALCLLLAVTSQSTAMMGGASAPTGQMVICAGQGVFTVYIDAEGAPTSAPHFCPECIMVFDSGPEQAVLALIGVAARFDFYATEYASYIGDAVPVGFQSRAPPV